MNLLINACTRPGSRTLPLARKAAARISDDFEELDLNEARPTPHDHPWLTMRDAFIEQEDYSHEMFGLAKQFREAEVIVIAAPYWDLSIPAILKCYIEKICVNGLTFLFDDSGRAKGLCRAKKLIYVTTAGGFIPERNFGYDYIRQLCIEFFGIPETVYIKAEGLDLVGADVDGIIEAAEREIERLLP